MVSGRKFRTLNIIDDCAREALAIEVDTSLSAKRVTRVLNRTIAERGKPVRIRVDNGPEYTSSEFVIWTKDKQITIQYTQPGRPIRNGFTERFNRLYREAILDTYLFYELYGVRQLKTEWLEEYNHRRPYEALVNMTPDEYKTWLMKRKNIN